MSSVTLNIPEISSDAGDNNDGIIFSSVAISPLDFIASKRVDATNVKFYRRDSTGSGFNFVDLSTAASQSTANDVAPFGETADMTAFDSFYVSDTDQAIGLYVQVTTQGDWDGAGLKIFDSTDGITADRELTGVVDPSDGFRNGPDWYKITWNNPGSPSVAFSPVPGDIPSRKYIRITLDGFTGVTTAPKLGRLVVALATDAHKYTDVTSIANGSLISAPTLPDYFPDTNEETIFHFSDPAMGAERYVFQERTAGIETVVWEYLASDNTWKPKATINDPSDNATVVPSGSPEQFSMRWSIEDDWVPMLNSITLTNDTVYTATAYWMRVRVTAVSDYGFIPSPLQRLRARKFGASTTTGITSPAARTFNYINVISIGGLSGDDCVTQITNMNTGRSSSFTIPAVPTLPLNVDITDIALSAGQKFGIQWLSGANSLTDVQLIANYTE